MFEEARRLRGLTADTLEAYHQTRSTLHTIEKAHPVNREVLTLCARIREELSALVPGDFTDIYPPERLTEIPRYLRAMEIRAKRGANNPEKDLAKALQIAPFLKAYGEITEDLSPHATGEKHEAVETFRWMIEEFKVSLFAQELKTRFPISVKRLEKKRREIDRMV